MADGQTQPVVRINRAELAGPIATLQGQGLRPLASAG